MLPDQWSEVWEIPEVVRQRFKWWGVVEVDHMTIALSSNSGGRGCFVESQLQIVLFS